MKHRTFAIASTVVLFLAAGVVAGLALFSTVVAHALVPDVPDAVAYLPADSEAVFGINVQAFLQSEVYARIQQKHGDKIGQDLAEFTAKTGVNPRTDIDYIVAGGRSLSDMKGSGAVIAIGRFNSAAITTFISSQANPIKVDYNGASVLMIPEAEGSKVEKGIAFLSENVVAMGTLDALKSVLDVKKGGKPSVMQNPTLEPLIRSLDPREMFWFAGDASNILAKAPTTTPLGSSVSAIQTIVGTLRLTDAVDGKVTVTARDKESAQKLADVARGLVALGQLASDKNPEIGELLKGLSIANETGNKITLTIHFSYDVLEKLEQSRPAVMKKVV